MKLNLTTLLWFTVLGVFLLLAGIFGVRTYMLGSNLRKLNYETVFANNRHALVQQLINDCGDYSKQHPAINPIMEALVGKPPAAK